MQRFKVLMLVAALMLPGAVACAQPTTFTGSLTQAIEVPPTGVSATGTATVTLDPTAKTLRVQATFSGLTSGVVMAHIHCCLPSLFQTGVNVPVATTVPAFAGFPLGVTSGTYDRVLDLTQASSYNPAFVTAQGGTVAGAQAALINGIKNGLTYFNIHTTNFPSGEIRDFLSAVPTPAALSLLKTIPINGTAASTSTKLFSFDISYVDPATGLFYLADRSNAALDVIDTTGAFTGKAETLFGQIGGPGIGFAGDTGSTATSGPNGVAAASPCVFASDSAASGGGRVVSINTGVSFTTLASSVNTGGVARADELAFDPKDNVLVVINNADTPPFATFLNVNPSTCALTIASKLTLNAANKINATNGAEQPQWQGFFTQKFFLSVPEVDGDGSGAFPKGAVAQINPNGTLEGLYQVNFCQPAGNTVGPNGDLQIGCNSVFDTSATPTSTTHKCTAVVPSPSPAGTAAGAPATCNNGISGAQEVVCNPFNGCTPSNGSIVSVPGVGGGDEVWYNPGDGNYYATAGNNPGGPALAVIASKTNKLTQSVSTLPPVPAVPSGAGKHSAGTVHSVAASAINNHVYVALPANTSYPNCVQGCIAVFGAQ